MAPASPASTPTSRDARWAAGVPPAADNARKGVENAIKAAIACYGPVPRTHDAAASLSELLQATSGGH